MSYPINNFIDFKFLNQNWSCHVDDIDQAILDLEEVKIILKKRKNEIN